MNNRYIAFEVLNCLTFFFWFFFVARTGKIVLLVYATYFPDYVFFLFKKTKQNKKTQRVLKN